VPINYRLADLQKEALLASHKGALVVREADFVGEASADGNVEIAVPNGSR